MTSTEHEARGAVRILLAAAFSFSLMSLFVRLAGERVPSIEVVLMRGLITLVLTAAFLYRARWTNWRGTRKGLLFLRGAFGFSALACFFYSVTHLPLAEATVIQFTSPIFTAVIGSLYLKERTTSRLWAAIALGLVGVLLITRPGVVWSGDASDLPGTIVLIGLAGALFTAVSHVLVRRLAPYEHELVIMLYFHLVVVPMALASAVPVWVWPTPVEWLLLLAIGVAAQGGQVFLTRGMKHLSAAGASVILYSQIVFATLLGVVVLHERPDVWTITGSLLVLGGTLVASRRPRLPA